MGLTFLTPLMLAGAALIAVPIVLHLIMRREPKHLVFPALRFIQRREEANRRRLRLRHLLLLLLRCAGIVFLALAIARPTVKSAGIAANQETPVAAALVFDTSVRMEYQHENKTRLAAAQDIALWLLTQLPPDSDVAVAESSAMVTTFAVDPIAARNRVERLAATAAPQPWLEVCESALRLVNESSKERKEVYLFTDLARASWPADQLARFRARLAAFEDVAIYVIDVGVEAPRNFGIGDLNLSGQTVAKNSRVRILTELARIGPAEDRAVGMYLFDRAGEPQKVGERSFSWIDGQAIPAEFELKGLGLGTHQGMLKILGDDALSADNVRYFTFEVRPAWKLLTAAPESATTLFLENALAPEERRKTGDVRFDVQTIALGKLAAEPLDEYSAVFLLDPAPLPAATWDKLREYVQYGGGLAICLGAGASEIETFNNAAALELLPSALLRQARSSDDLFLAPPDLQHPVLRGFRSKGSQVPWSSFPVFKYWQFDELKEGVNVVIPFTNSRPALMEQALGRGRVLTLTTPVSHSPDERAPWNMLATGFGNWPFFVLMQEMGAYLAGNLEETFNCGAGETVVLRLPEAQRSLIYTLRTPLDLSIPQTVDERQGTLTVTTTQVAGNYQLQAGGSEGGVRRGFSANVPLAATRLDRIGKEDLDSLLGGERYRLARSQEEIKRDVEIGRVGVELYPLLIVLVSLVLGLEHVLANRFYRRDAKVAMEVPRPAGLEAPPISAPAVVTAPSSNGSRAGGSKPPIPPPLPTEPKQPATMA